MHRTKHLWMSLESRVFVVSGQTCFVISLLKFFFCFCWNKLVSLFTIVSPVYDSNFSSSSFFVSCWHACSYVPAQPQKKPKPYNQKLDYSHVKSRIDAGSPRSLASSKSASSSTENIAATYGRSKANHHHSRSPFLVETSHRHKSKVSAERSTSPSSKSVRSRSLSAGYSHIKSRIDSGLSTTPQQSKSARLSSSARHPHIKSKSDMEQSSNSLKSSVADYSHIRSRIDSGRKSSLMLSGLQTSRSSMSHSKVSWLLVSAHNMMHRLQYDNHPGDRSGGPLSPSFPPPPPFFTYGAVSLHSLNSIDDLEVSGVSVGTYLWIHLWPLGAPSDYSIALVIANYNEQVCFVGLFTHTAYVVFITCLMGIHNINIC